MGVEPVDSRQESNPSQLGGLPALAAYDGPYRRLVCAVLVQAVDDAAKGSQLALDWIGGEYARAMAEAVGLPRWPPPALMRRGQMQDAARALATEAELVGGIGLASMGRARRKKDLANDS